MTDLSSGDIVTGPLPRGLKWLLIASILALVAVGVLFVVLSPAECLRDVDCEGHEYCGLASSRVAFATSAGRAPSTGVVGKVKPRYVCLQDEPCPEYGRHKGQCSDRSECKPGTMCPRRPAPSAPEGMSSK